ncbi:MULTISPECIES: hypothetical protein [Enterobacteriaceae]|uniref:hypothetical protein n=1 Tax=Enterobacteriaceae TaxID=543 RepID=UPI00390B8E73|nr:hypothetical protein [Escherichia coli]
MPDYVKGGKIDDKVFYGDMVDEPEVIGFGSVYLNSDNCMCARLQRDVVKQGGKSLEFSC